MQNKEPFQIAGAGLAGLSASIVLANAGYSVVVHEAREGVGHRFQGDLQGLENWTSEHDILEVMQQSGLSTDFAKYPCRSGKAFDAWDKSYEMHSQRPIFYLVERGPGPDTLDTALLNQAKSLGVDIRFNSRLDDISGSGILAIGPRATYAIAVGYHFETDMENGFWVICDDNLAPQGYAYLLVLNGKGMIKSCMFSGFKDKRQYIERTIAAFKRLTRLQMINPTPHGGIVNFHIPVRAINHHHPIIGEQAGFQDALWGFGMRYAITSGVMAANCLMNSDDYDAKWQRDLKHLMQVSVVNRAIYSRLGNRGYRYMLDYLSRNRDARETLQYHYNSVWWKTLLWPWAHRAYRK